MQELHGAPVIEGDADGQSPEALEFRDEKTGQVTPVAVNPQDGKFRTQLPQGTYAVRQGTTRTALTALSGGVYHLEMRADHAFSLGISAETPQTNQVKLHVHAGGAGAHALDIRASNLQFKEPGMHNIELRPGHEAELVREGRVLDPNTPWVIVVIPDGILSAHQEVTGTSAVQK